MSCNSQNKIILKHLQKRPITAREAMLHYGIYRLAARIKDLRDGGYSIRTTKESYTNKMGRTVWYARYELIQACRDARDRLLPSLSIIDSQYATT